MAKVYEVLRELLEAGIRLKLEKCRLAQSKTEWLGYQIPESGVKPVDGKIKIFKESSVIDGGIESVEQFHSEIGEAMCTVKTTLNKDNREKQDDEKEEAFQAMKNETQEIAE